MLKSFRKILESVYLYVRLWRVAGFHQAVTLALANARGRDATHSLRLHGVDLTIRRRTPDLRVAVDNLDGEFARLQDLFPRSFDGVIVDAGGYIGTAAVTFARMFPAARIVSIEPSEANYAILEQNVRAFPNIVPLNRALVPPDVRSASLHNRQTGEWGFTIVSAPRDCPDAKPIGAVTPVSLIDLKREFDVDRIDLLKLDIEGGEKQLFDDADDALRDVDVVFVELHDRIVAGCRESFKRFSIDRTVVDDNVEKCLSMSRRFVEARAERGATLQFGSRRRRRLLDEYRQLRGWIKNADERRRIV